MFESDGTQQNGTNGISAETSNTKKRVLTKDLSAKVGELERKLAKVAEIDQTIAALADQIAKLDERVSKIAHFVAQSNLVR